MYELCLPLFQLLLHASLCRHLLLEVLLLLLLIEDTISISMPISIIITITIVIAIVVTSVVNRPLPFFGDMCRCRYIVLSVTPTFIIIAVAFLKCLVRILSL